MKKKIAQEIIEYLENNKVLFLGTGKGKGISNMKEVYGFELHLEFSTSSLAVFEGQCSIGAYQVWWDTNNKTLSFRLHEEKISSKAKNAKTIKEEFLQKLKNPQCVECLYEGT